MGHHGIIHSLVRVAKKKNSHGMKEKRARRKSGRNRIYKINVTFVTHKFILSLSLHLTHKLAEFANLNYRTSSFNIYTFFSKVFQS